MRIEPRTNFKCADCPALATTVLENYLGDEKVVCPAHEQQDLWTVVPGVSVKDALDDDYYRRYDAGGAND